MDQWSRPEPWRCRGYDPDAEPKGPTLPWAKKMWESANAALVAPEDPVKTLKDLVDTLTKRINGPDGCSKCAGHWDEYLKTHPVDATNLEEARLWLWNAHNATREGKTPVPFDEIAQKFQWL